MTKLKKLLKEKDISVTELSEKTGKCLRHTRRIVNGHSQGKIDWWIAVSRLLNVNIDDIIEKY